MRLISSWLKPFLTSSSSNEGDTCFVDQPSACGQTGAVSCSNLQDGTSEACCPALTTCASNFTASESVVRCIGTYDDLLTADINSTTSAASSTTSAAPAATSTGQSNNTVIVSSSSGLSGGAIAGIVVGSVAGVALIIVALWLILRKRYKGQSGFGRAFGRQQASNVYQAPEKDGSHMPQSPPSYVPPSAPPSSIPQELRGFEPSELDGRTETSRSPVSPFSMDKSVRSPRST